MTLITLNNISKAIAGNEILENITLKIEPSQKIGIVGANGSGKTTLLKIIAQKEHPTSGEIFWQKNIAIGLSEQIARMDINISATSFIMEQFHDILKLQQQLQLLEQKLSDNPTEKILKRYGDLQERFIEVGGYEIESTIQKIAQGLNIAQKLNTPFNELSVGEKTRIMLCRSLVRNPDILLLDEPTNHLDLQAMEWLAKYLKSYMGTVILVSHDRYLLDSVCTHILEVEEKEVQCYVGNFSSYQKQKETLILQQFAAYQTQQKQIQKMEQATKQMRIWAKQADNPKMFKRAKSMERALERIIRLKKPTLNPKTMQLQITSTKRSGKEVIKLEEASKLFDDKLILFDTTLQINFGEKVAIMGPNGAGKTTLLKIMLNQIPLDEGSAKLGSNVQYAYLSQELEELNPNHTILEAFRDQVMVSEYDARHLLATFLFYGYDVYKKIKDLSGGELMRLRLAWFIENKVNTLILDEPTNHLDIASREILENVLNKFQGTIITVSHDRYFINTVCGRILWLEDGMITSFIGNYDEFVKR